MFLPYFEFGISNIPWCLLLSILETTEMLQQLTVIWLLTVRGCGVKKYRTLAVLAHGMRIESY